jgi:hypothetical protein
MKVSARFAVIFLVLILIFGVSLTTAQTITPYPTETPMPPLELKGGLTLETHESAVDFDQPRLSIHVEKPVLIQDEGTPNPVAENFNAAVNKIIQKTAGDFQEGQISYALTATPPPDFGESSMDVRYEAYLPTDSFLSIWFDIGFYSAGAAHPGSYSWTLNYDLHTGSVLALADLFKPDVPYLETLAAYSKQVLNEKGVLLFPDGADPLEENYRNWNATPDGLLITFDEYQVAPYAAGSQQVTVPYSELAALLDPTSVLGSFAS